MPSLAFTPGIPNISTRFVRTDECEKGKKNSAVVLDFEVRIWFLCWSGSPISRKQPITMTSILKKTVDRIYSILLADAVGEFSASFKYKLFVVLLAFAMSSSAAYAILFLQS